MEPEKQKDRVIRLYHSHGSKRKVAQIIGKTRQYVIQEVSNHQDQNPNCELCLKAERKEQV